jgi:hypothetical protein
MGDDNFQEGYVEENVQQGIMEQNSTEQVKFILAPSDVIIEIGNFLSGRYYDSEMDRYYTESPVLNRRGVAEIMRIINLRVSRVFSLTKLSDKEIGRIMDSFCKELVFLLYMNRREFNLDKKYIPHVIHEISDAVFAVLKQSQDDNMKEFLKLHAKTVEHVRHGDKNKGGLFAK